MNATFEITEWDVLTVLKNLKTKATVKRAKQIFKDIIYSRLDQIEHSALLGNTLEDQTNFAHKEIKYILEENDI